MLTSTQKARISMTESLSHFGPWTTDDLAGLPDDGQRYEIIDGSLLVTPTPAPRHQLMAGRISVFLRETAPDEADVVEATNLQLSTGRLLVPDVIVAQSSALLAESVALVPADVHLVVEVVSPSNAAMDRVFKPQLYAAAGIPWMWRVELVPDGVEIVVLDLRSGLPAVHARSTDVLRGRCSVLGGDPGESPAGAQAGVEGRRNGAGRPGELTALVGSGGQIGWVGMDA